MKALRRIQTRHRLKSPWSRFKRKKPRSATVEKMLHSRW
uniref:Uncharacterized protein n=1 Tax=Brassica oleracea TaxID=3712 RepID=A0A3P6DWP3_BRAOL|nr:unnamed protein product [Brassica oleracea]